MTATLTAKTADGLTTRSPAPQYFQIVKGGCHNELNKSAEIFGFLIRYGKQAGNSHSSRPIDYLKKVFSVLKGRYRIVRILLYYIFTSQLIEKINMVCVVDAERRDGIRLPCIWQTD